MELSALQRVLLIEFDQKTTKFGETFLSALQKVSAIWRVCLREIPLYTLSLDIDFPIYTLLPCLFGPPVYQIFRKFPTPYYLDLPFIRHQRVLSGCENSKILCNNLSYKCAHKGIKKLRYFYHKLLKDATSRFNSFKIASNYQFPPQPGDQLSNHNQEWQEMRMKNILAFILNKKKRLFQRPRYNTKRTNTAILEQEEPGTSLRYEVQYYFLIKHFLTNKKACILSYN